MSERRPISRMSLNDHFSQMVRTALEHHETRQTDPATLGYLVQLLCDFTRRPMSELEQPLALVLVTIQRVHPNQRMAQLKRIGDDALYLCGFLREHAVMHRMDRDYYGTLGGAAYRRLSDTIRRSHDGTRLIAVYQELAENFEFFADLLSDVYAQSLPDSDVGLLYEKWLWTQSRYLEHKLREAGVVITKKRSMLN